MTVKFAIFSLVLTAATPVLAQQDFYNDQATENCLEEAILPAERSDCVGASKRACIDEIGQANAPLCISEEAAFWDYRLNVNYQRQLSRALENDPALEDVLRQMQRAWIAYRDARCDAVDQFWGEGTGRIPAVADCLMRTTATQALFLEDEL